MGRLWQHILLVRYHRLFEYLPIESVIHAHQREYCRVLGACDQAGSSTLFVEFSLAIIEETLRRFLQETRLGSPDPSGRLDLARGEFVHREFSRKDYLVLFPTLSTATASRDLKRGVEEGLLVAAGVRALTRYRFR
jgi:Fic family protein